jgi:hypothetical protein
MYDYEQTHYTKARRNASGIGRPWEKKRRPWESFGVHEWQSGAERVSIRSSKAYVCLPMLRTSAPCGRGTGNYEDSQSEPFVHTEALFTLHAPG